MVPPPAYCATRNCGIEVEVQGRDMKRIRGRPLASHLRRLSVPEGPTVELLSEPLRQADVPAAPPRRREPLKKSPGNTAIREIASKLVHLRDT